MKRESGFYLIKIKQWIDRDNRKDDVWSVAKWDGKEFEELNEIYKEEQVVEVNETELITAVNNYDRLVSGIEKYVLHWDKFFGDPKVGQPPSLDELRQLLNDIKKP